MSWSCNLSSRSPSVDCAWKFLVDRNNTEETQVWAVTELKWVAVDRSNRSCNSRAGELRCQPGRVELFSDVPGRRGFGRDVPVYTPARGCAYEWSSVDQFPWLLVVSDEVWRQDVAASSSSVVGNEATFRVSRWVIGPTVPGRHGVAVPSSVDRRQEQEPLLHR